MKTSDVLTAIDHVLAGNDRLAVDRLFSFPSIPDDEVDDFIRLRWSNPYGIVIDEDYLSRVEHEFQAWGICDQFLDLDEELMCGGIDTRTNRWVITTGPGRDELVPHETRVESSGAILRGSPNIGYLRASRTSETDLEAESHDYPRPHLASPPVPAHTFASTRRRNVNPDHVSRSDRIAEAFLHAHWDRGVGDVEDRTSEESCSS